MAIPAGTTVPKTITRIKTEYHGFPIKYIIVAFATALFLLFMLTGALVTGSAVGKVIFLLLLLGGTIFFVVFMRSPDQMEISWRMYKYFVRVLTGKHVTAKYVLPASFLMTVVPIKQFHEGGLIEFTGNRYGVLMRIEPSRISDDDLDSHIEKNRELVDSLHSELVMKFYVVSVFNDNNDLDLNIVNIINKEDRTQKQKDHLYSIYHHLQNSTKSIIHWKYYIFISLGEQKNLQLAKIAKTQYIPGIESKLNKSGVHVIQITNSEDLALSYRQCLNVRIRG